MSNPYQSESSVKLDCRVKVNMHAPPIHDRELNRLWRLPEKPQKIYLAAPLSSQGEALRFALQLVDAGFIVTSSWLRNDFLQKPGKDSLHYNSYEAKWGKVDLADLYRSDTLVILAKEKSSSGGYHVELGYFLGAGRKNIIIVGERWNVFFYTDDVRWTQNEGFLIEWLLSDAHGENPTSASWSMPAEGGMDLSMETPGGTLTDLGISELIAKEDDPF